MADLISSYRIDSDGKLRIKTPYCDDIVRQCRRWSGKFDRATNEWVVASTRLDDVRKLLGTIDADGDYVEVEVSGEQLDTRYEPQIRIGWFVVASTRGRDATPDVFAELVAGEIKSGGSRKNYHVELVGDCRFRFWVPRDFAVARELQIVTDPRDAEASAETLSRNPATAIDLDDPTICALANMLRNAMAAKRDLLAGRQRGQYDDKRQAQIQFLGDKYREVYEVALETGLDRLPEDQITAAMRGIADQINAPE